MVAEGRVQGSKIKAWSAFEPRYRGKKRGTKSTLGERFPLLKRGALEVLTGLFRVLYFCREG
jgi:hypothetical protein